jgi:hypothetical protein
VHNSWNGAVHAIDIRACLGIEAMGIHIGRTDPQRTADLTFPVPCHSGGPEDPAAIEVGAGARVVWYQDGICKMGGNDTETIAAGGTIPTNPTEGGHVQRHGCKVGTDVIADNQSCRPGAESFIGDHEFVEKTVVAAIALLVTTTQPGSVATDLF